MPAVVFFSHVPTLRLAEDVPFAAGELVRLPWDDYDHLSQGAFSDFKYHYEQTEPVFYRMDVPDLEDPVLSDAPSTGGMMELSAPTATWGELLPAVGLDLVRRFAFVVDDLAWTTLLIGAPAAAPAQPSLSVMFAFRGDDSTSFVSQGNHFNGVRVDGDAGPHLLFSPRAAGQEVPRATVERANGLHPLVRSATRQPALAAAIGALRALTHPSLSPAEQTTLAVVALEALLLPEVRTGLGPTFARRVATLLAPEGDERASLDKAARALYDARSASLHGGSSQARGGRAASPALAQRLLAAAIESLAAAAGKDGDVAGVCGALDDGQRPNAAVTPDLADVAGLQATRRLSARSPKYASGFSIGGPSIAAEEGKLLSFSPLVGLTCGEGWELGEGSNVFITPASAEAILTAEDKDIRRELGNLRMVETPVASLAVIRDGERASGEAVAEMLRKRDLAVIALRLSGFAAFVDPELCGSYVYEGTSRTIDSTIFAPALLRGMGAEPDESFGKDAIERFAAEYGLVTQYDARARHPEIDHVLTLYRRAHDVRFLPPDGRARLLIGLVEAMLGRFRPPDEPVQLEDLVRRVAGSSEPAAADWFTDGGRALRNAIAHGYWDGDAEPLTHVQALLRPLVRAFVGSSLQADDHQRRPGRAFIDTVAAVTRA